MDEHKQTDRQTDRTKPIVPFPILQMHLKKWYEEAQQNKYKVTDFQMHAYTLNVIKTALQGN